MYEALAPDKCELLSMRSSRDSATDTHPQPHFNGVITRCIQRQGLRHQSKLQVMTVLLRVCVIAIVERIELQNLEP